MYSHTVIHTDTHTHTHTHTQRLTDTDKRIELKILTHLQNLIDHEGEWGMREAGKMKFSVISIIVTATLHFLFSYVWPAAFSFVYACFYVCVGG